MPFVALVRKTREDMKLTQSDIALNVGISQAMWSKYENRETTMPHDLANKISKILGNPRLKALYTYQEKTELFNVPFLDNVDDNSIVVLDSLAEELKEAAECCEVLKKILRNKKNGETIPDLQWEEILNCEEQIVDVIPAIKLHHIKMVEEFQLDLERLEQRFKVKLKSKNYIK